MKHLKEYIFGLCLVFTLVTIIAAPVLAADNSSSFGILAGGKGIFGGIVGYLFFALVLYRIAQKLEKHNHAWWAFIPFLNVLLVFEMADLPCLFVFLLLIPVVNVAVAIFAWYMIIVNLGKPFWHILFILIPGVNFFYMIYLAL